MRTCLLLSLASIVSVPSTVLADSGERVTIADVIAAAARTSPRLVIARSQAEEAGLLVTATGLIDEWKLVGGIALQESVVDRALSGPSLPFDTTSKSAELGVQKSLPSGGSVAVSFGASRVHKMFAVTARSDGTLPPDISRGAGVASARIVAGHALLRGIGVDVARGAQHQAKLQARAQSVQSADEAAALVRDLVVAYGELYYATESLAVDRDGEEVARKQLTITRDIVKNGLQPQSAVKRAELELALRQEAILRGEVAVAESSDNVRLLAGLEIEDVPLLPVALTVPSDDVDTAETIKAARAHGPALVQLGLAKQIADIDVDVANNARLPRLDLSVSAEVSGVAPTVASAVSRIDDADEYTLMAGLSFQWELGGSAKAVASAARIRRTRIVTARADVVARLEVAATTAIRQLNAARRRIGISETAVAVAVDALRAELVAFQGGRATNVSVFQRRDEAAEARLRLARARVDALIAITIIDYLTGGLLERYGVEIAGTEAHS